MSKARFVYILFRAAVFKFKFIPFSVLFILSDFFAFFAQYIIKYRKKVISDNLKKAFPEKNSIEIKNIAKKTYKNLADILLEGIKGYSISEKEIKKRFVILNPEIADKYAEKNINIIILSSHYTNWEWSALAVPMIIKHESRGLYKTLSNTFIDKYVYKRRAVFGMKLYPITKTREFFTDKSDRPAAFYMIADQNPANVENAIRKKFFNIETAFLHGPQKYFDRLKIPVVYIHYDRVKRGFYQARFYELVCENETNYEIDLTERYVRLMEDLIRKKPENWLWSHKRWKLKL